MDADNKPVVRCGFVGPSSAYAKFRIKTVEYNKIIVAHEGNWIGSLLGNRPYKYYEDVQAELGRGFKFKKKEYFGILKRSFFIYERDDLSLEYSIVVPATGEDIRFEIYGLIAGHLYLLWSGEV